MHHYIADIIVKYIETVSGMTSDELVAELQYCDSNDEMATKQFLIVK